MRRNTKDTSVRACQLVPWSCDAEWKHVFDLLYDPDPLKRTRGVEMVQIWKVRLMGEGQQLSVSVDVTADLVQALLSFERKGGHTAAVDSCEARLSLSAAVIRCISLVAESEQDKHNVKPMSELCANMGIPLWITVIRHNSTHAEMPSANLLALACHTCLQVLKDKYWFPQWLILFEMQEKTDIKVKRIISRWLTGQISPNDFGVTLEKLMEQTGLKTTMLMEFLVKYITCFPNQFASLLADTGCRKALMPLESCLLMHFKEFVLTLLTTECIIERPTVFLDLMSSFNSDLIVPLNKKRKKRIFGCAFRTGNIDVIKRALGMWHESGQINMSSESQDVLVHCFALIRRRDKAAQRNDMETLKEVLEKVKLLKKELCQDKEEGKEENEKMETAGVAIGGAGKGVKKEDESFRLVEKELMYVDDTSWQRLLID